MVFGKFLLFFFLLVNSWFVVIVFLWGFFVFFFFNLEICIAAQIEKMSLIHEAAFLHRGLSLIYDLLTTSNVPSFARVGSHPPPPPPHSRNLELLS
jgi:hypothetical protein